MLSPHRQQLIDAMEAHFQSLCAPEDRMFAKYPDKDHIIVSHALFWVMSRSLVKKLPKLKSFYLLVNLRKRCLQLTSPSQKTFQSCFVPATLSSRAYPTNCRKSCTTGHCQSCPPPTVCCHCCHRLWRRHVRRPSH